MIYVVLCISSELDKALKSVKEVGMNSNKLQLTQFKNGFWAISLEPKKITFLQKPLFMMMTWYRNLSSNKIRFSYFLFTSYEISEYATGYLLPVLPCNWAYFQQYWSLNFPRIEIKISLLHACIFAFATDESDFASGYEITWLLKINFMLSLKKLIEVNS